MNTVVDIYISDHVFYSVRSIWLLDLSHVGMQELITNSSRHKLLQKVSMYAPATCLLFFETTWVCILCLRLVTDCYMECASIIAIIIML